MYRIAILAVIIAIAVTPNKARAAESSTKSAVDQCLGEVHRQKPEFGAGWFQDFDAYLDPATGLIHELGAQRPTFVFEKCMALKGHSLQQSSKD